MTDDKLLTAEQAAVVLDLPLFLVHHLIVQGELVSLSAADVLAYSAERDAERQRLQEIREQLERRRRTAQRH